MGGCKYPFPPAPLFPPALLKIEIFRTGLRLILSLQLLKVFGPHYFFTRFDLAASNFIVLEAKIIVTIEYVSGKSALPKNSH